MTKPNKLAGKTITQEVFLLIQARHMQFDDPEKWMAASCFDWSTDDATYTRLASAQVTFTIPADFDPVPQQVAALNAEKAKLTAEFTAAVAKLNQRLSELQAIEFDGAQA